MLGPAGVIVVVPNEFITLGFWFTLVSLRVQPIVLRALLTDLRI